MPERRIAAATAPKRGPREVLVAALLALGSSGASAQAVPVGDPRVDHARLLEITSVDPWSGRWPSPDSARDGRGLQLRLLPAGVRLAFNSARPWGINDGAMWQGKGATTAFSAGAFARWGPISAVLQPVVIRSENAGFGLSSLPGDPDLGPFSYPSGVNQTLDMPQRFGDGSFDTFDLGNSYIRADVGPVAGGLSNESLWWGPARRNAIAMTNNAPGFGHAWLGTSGPLDVRVGTIDARWHWGRLRESQYFDATAANDSRYFTGLVASFSPKGAPGFEVGVTRTFLAAWNPGGPDIDEVLLVLVPLQKKSLATPENPTGDDATDQMATLFARWAFPQAGFEAYGEWGRGDHSWDLRDLVTQPEHASAWMLGFQKAIDPEPTRLWRLGAELTILGAARTSLVRPPAQAFYAHHIIRQGYTQRGQVMGAGIGPGSSQVSVTLERVARWGRVGAGLQRTVYDNNRFYAEDRLWDTNEAEPAAMVDALLFRGPWELGGSLTAAKLLNKDYERRNDEVNLNVNLGVRYHFGQR